MVYLLDQWGRQSVPAFLPLPASALVARSPAIHRQQNLGYCLPVATLPLKRGLHFFNVEAWDSSGNNQKSSRPQKAIMLTGSIMEVVP